jgi:trehalose/maltose transport system substrate-binding protein
MACNPGDAVKEITPVAKPAPQPSAHSVDSLPDVADDIKNNLEEYADQAITINFYGDQDSNPNLDKILAQKFFTDTQITVNVIPTLPLERRDIYERLFQAHSTDIDVMMLDVIWSSAFAPHLRTDVFTDADLEQHQEASARNSKIGNKIVALPWFLDFGVLYYRADLLEKYRGSDEPPKDWSTFEEMAKTIQSNERQAGNPNFWGFVWQGKAYEGLTCDALEWIYSHQERSGEDEDKMVQVNTTAAKDALIRARTWIWGSDTVTQTISPPDVLDFKEPDATKVFTSGNAAFMRGWPTAINDLNKDPLFAGKYKVAPLPSSDGQHTISIIGGQQLGVSAYSNHRDIAAAFVRYMTSPDVQFWRAARGAYVPTINPKIRSYNTDLQNEALFKKFHEDDTKMSTPGQTGSDETKTPPIGQPEDWDPLGKFNKVVLVPRPTSSAGPNYDAFSAAFYSGVHYFLSHKDQNVEQFARRLDQRIQLVISGS